MSFYNYFRDYDPSLGRYIQSDPIGLDGGINTYGYALQNPLMYSDPTGEAAQLVVVVLVAAYAGYTIWKKIVTQEECQRVCKEEYDEREKCEDNGNNNGLLKCKTECVQKTWSTTFRRGPLPKRL
ncbi:RHS repeat-associated core domain-containing protein [Microbulbifer sp. 2304DJ12-6]|uniref:RHS repeat-associated core domain-containing protein n=1 Tax=Microbulbifer sp. 2304DJ12-6 TaxID=3233340 RepID=UPI0039B05FA4